MDYVIKRSISAEGSLPLPTLSLTIIAEPECDNVESPLEASYALAICRPSLRKTVAPQQVAAFPKKGPRSRDFRTVAGQLGECVRWVNWPR